MAEQLSVAGFVESARGFGQSALVAHGRGDARRVALDAGTAVEHLAKACLCRRSPALLVDLRGDQNFVHLARLLGLPEGLSPRPLRTVGLRGALDRVSRFVVSDASGADLGTLVDMRDGTVHAAQNAEVEERLVVAFVQYADALLADLGSDRALFWGVQLGVVDALLADATDKVQHAVDVRMAAAEAQFDAEYASAPAELLRVVLQLGRLPGYGPDEGPANCPVCGAIGLAGGRREVDWGAEVADGEVVNAHGMVSFEADRFGCRVCGLRLDSAAELKAAGMQSRWDEEDANPVEFEGPLDEDAAYEAWRDDQREAEG